LASVSDQLTSAVREPGRAPAYRVLHVLDHSWPVLSGYSIRSRSLITAQASIGLLPTVLTGPLHQLEDNGLTDDVFDGIEYYRTPISGLTHGPALRKRVPVLRERSVVALLKKEILELAKRKKFDVIHAHSPALCGLGAAQAAAKLGIPFVYEIRAFWEDGAVDQQRTTRKSLRYHLSRALETNVAKRADAVVGIAEHILHDMKSRGIAAAKLFHVPNGVDAAKFPPRPRDARLAQELGLGGEPVFGFIGTHYRFEGLAWLVRAAAELHRRGARFSMLFIGDGEDVGEINKAIAGAKAGEYIRLLGRIPHDHIQRYYSVMDIMVYPRRKNRLTELVTPLKPLEAMSQSKAVMASDLPALRELVVPEKTGLLFQWDDIGDFCRQAERLLSEPGLREKLGVEARERVLEEKNWPVLAQRYRAVYAAVGAQKE